MEDWLRAIGLQERIPAFREQRIEASQLAELGDSELRELGLTIGERLRFRRALAERTAPPPPVSIATTPTVAERRPLTVVFIDLVDSSALAERLESEDLLEVIRRYREFCGAAIQRFGGHVARLVGDGILAYFCYPIANENDPERAVRASMDVAAGVGELQTPAGRRLAVRIGIATGRVIISDLVAGGAEDPRSVIGSTPNLAARLQAFAAPGGIVLAEETEARVQSAFLCEEIGTRALRGFAEPHRIFRVVGAITDPGRLGNGGPRRAPPRLTRFYDREGETAILNERWQRACRAEGGVVLVLGEAGIGKSRLVEQFIAELAATDARIVQFAASPFDEDSALHPFVAALRATARLEAEDAPDARRAKLAAILGGDTRERAEHLPILASLIDGGEAEAAIGNLSPGALRERTLAALSRQLLLLAETGPLCLVVEDLHWLDPTSGELLARIVSHLNGSRLMLLLTARDGYVAPWVSGRSTTVLRLVPLAQEDVAGMVQSLFGDQPVPAHLGRQIARKTDGVPLFVEEFVRALQQRQHPPDWGTTLLDEADQEIPASLHESLMARLDRTGPAKIVAQVAAVVGRSVRRDILADVADLPPASLTAALSALQDAEVLSRSDVDGVEIYVFTHALVRDAAYDSMLRDRRRALHARVAQALQTLDPESVAQQPELLALHLTEADLAEQAASHWLEAGRRHLGRSALTEASRLLRRGLAAIEKRPANPATLDLRLRLMELLGPALIALKGPGSAEAQELYGSAYELCQALPESPAHFPLYWGWWRITSDYHVKTQRAATLLRRAEEQDDPGLLLQAHHCSWASHYIRGELAQSGRHIHRGLALYGRGSFSHHARLYGNHDARVCAHGNFAQICWQQGKLISAMAEQESAGAWARDLDHLGSLAHAMDMRLLHSVYRRAHRDVFDQAGQFVAFTSEHGLDDHRSKGLIFRGWAVAMQASPAAGLATLQEGLVQQREAGTMEDFPVYLCLLGEALAVAGKPDRAVVELTAARAEFEAVGLHNWMPDLLRTLGDVTLAADPRAIEPTRALYAEAADMAARQGAAMLGLRVAVSAARLDARLGQADVGADRLDAALALIAEDDRSTDLLAAGEFAAALHARLGRRRVRTEQTQ